MLHLRTHILISDADLVFWDAFWQKILRFRSENAAFLQARILSFIKTHTCAYVHVMNTGPFQTLLVAEEKTKRDQTYSLLSGTFLQNQNPMMYTHGKLDLKRLNWNLNYILWKYTTKFKTRVTDNKIYRHSEIGKFLKEMGSYITVTEITGLNKCGKEMTGTCGGF